MAKAKKADRLPLRVCDCSDLVRKVDGAEFHPHVGESVTFRGGVTWPQIQRSFKLDLLIGDAEWDMAKVTTYYELFDASVRDMAEAVVEWNWTNAYTGEPYLNPPTAEVILGLDLPEVQYLVRRFNGAEITKGEEQPSTSS